VKKLCLIRHAKSSWDNPAIEDHERPLDPRGEADAALMGGFLAKKQLKPDIILASNATRAVDTARIIAEQVGVGSDKIDSEEQIYDAGVEDLLAMIQDLPSDYQTVFLVGHNPGLTWLANYLAEDHLINLPTCGAYCVAFDTDSWANIKTVEGKTLFFESPKQHSE